MVMATRLDELQSRHWRSFELNELVYIQRNSGRTCSYYLSLHAHLEISRKQCVSCLFRPFYRTVYGPGSSTNVHSNLIISIFYLPVGASIIEMRCQMSKSSKKKKKTWVRYKKLQPPSRCTCTHQGCRLAIRHRQQWLRDGCMCLPQRRLRAPSQQHPLIPHPISLQRRLRALSRQHVPFNSPYKFTATNLT